jgi:hypothetical protein
MEKLLYVLALILISSFSYSQEYDDMYYNKNDRHSKTIITKINPEYVSRYTYSTPVVYTTYQPYYYGYNKQIIANKNNKIITIIE